MCSVVFGVIPCWLRPLAQVPPPGPASLVRAGGRTAALNARWRGFQHSLLRADRGYVQGNVLGRQKKGFWEGVGDTKALIYQIFTSFSLLWPATLGLFANCAGDEPHSTQIIEGLCSAHSHLTWALMSPWEQNTGQGENTIKFSNSHVCSDWPRVLVLLFLKRKGLERHRDGWNHPRF